MIRGLFYNNVKIVGLNVCGLRSKLNDISFENFAIKYEIICLSETKTDHIDLSGTKLNGEYSCFTKEKSVNSHRHGGVHGLAMIIKKNIAEHAQLLADVQSPYVLWVKFSEKAFGFECILGSAYLPGEDSKYKDNEMFEVISNDIFKLKNTYKLPICLLGDLNSRTGELDDCFNIEQSIINNCEIDEFAQELFDISPINETDTMPMKRYNRDTTINNNGKLLIEFCKVNGMKIVNGRLGSDKEIGEFTFRGSSDRNSTIDYCIVSPDLGPHIQNFEISSFDDHLSDFHCPIILTLNTSPPITNEPDSLPESDVDYSPVSTKWCDEKKAEFQSKFDTGKIEEVSHLLNTLNPNNISKYDMDNIAKKLVNIPTTAGVETGISKQSSQSNNTPRPKDQNKLWFDHECHLKRKQHFRKKK